MKPRLTVESVRNARLTPLRESEVGVHVVPDALDDGEAYDHTQVTPGVRGKVLVHKGRVGYMYKAWPVQVVGKHGAWHELNPDAKDKDAELEAGVAAARAHAAKLGITESDWGMKGMKDDSHEEYGSELAKSAAKPAAPAKPADGGIKHVAGLITAAHNAHLDWGYKLLSKLGDAESRKTLPPADEANATVERTHEHKAGAMLALAYAVAGRGDRATNLRKAVDHLEYMHKTLGGHSYKTDDGDFSPAGFAAAREAIS